MGKRRQGSWMAWGEGETGQIVIKDSYWNSWPSRFQILAQALRWESSLLVLFLIFKMDVFRVGTRVMWLTIKRSQRKKIFLPPISSSCLAPRGTFYISQCKFTSDWGQREGKEKLKKFLVLRQGQSWVTCSAKTCDLGLLVLCSNKLSLSAWTGVPDCS